MSAKQVKRDEDNAEDAGLMETKEVMGVRGVMGDVPDRLSRRIQRRRLKMQSHEEEEEEEEEDDDIKGLDDDDAEADQYTIRFKTADADVDIPYGPFRHYRRSMIQTSMDALIAEGDTGNPEDKILPIAFENNIKFPVKKSDIDTLMELIYLFPTGPPKRKKKTLPHEIICCSPEEIEFYGIPKRPLESTRPEIVFKPNVAQWMSKVSVEQCGRTFALANYLFLLPIIDLCGAGLMQKYISMGSPKAIAKKLGIPEVTDHEMKKLIIKYPEIGRI